jgi:uncharacterized delta-60 repeat protein
VKKRARNGAKTRALVWLTAMGAGAGAAACTGILGLDQTSLREQDAAAGDAAPAPDAGEDGGGADAAPMEAGDASPADAPGSETSMHADTGVADTGVADATGSDAAPDGPVFTTVPTTIVVPQGGSQQVQVDVQRNGQLPGVLSVDFTQLPSGVMSTMGSIPANVNTTVVTLSATAVAAVGTTNVSLQANGKTYASVPITVSGASGSIDTTFGGGYVVGTLSGTIFNAVAIDAQGGVVAAGALSGGGWVVRRYQADGTDDLTFDAKAAAVVPSSGSGINGMAIDPVTGDIVIGGVANGGQLAVMVLNANGTANGGFNGGLPYSSTPVFTQSSAANGVAILPGQTFFAVGNSVQGTSVPALSVPLGESNATPPSDPFGASDISTSGAGYAAAAVDPNGRLVAAGSGPVSGMPTSILLARYTKTGAFDATFGDAGAPFVEKVFPCTGSAAVVRPKTGSIFVSGYDSSAPNGNGCFGEWSSAGANLYWKQGSPGGGGIFDYAGAAAMGDAQDRIYLVGSGGDMYSRTAELDRLLTSGAYDTTFGTTGQVQLDPGGSPPAFYFTLRAVAVQPDGRIVIAGQRTGSSGVFSVLGRFWP